MSMDWDKILKDQEEKKGAYAAIPAGKYPVTVLECESVVASTGAKMLKTTCVIDGGPYAERKLINPLAAPSPSASLAASFGHGSQASPSFSPSALP